MAGGKTTPRQKMVGMMYLVLTALLALNVSKDILEAFEVVNDGLEVSIESFEQKNGALYGAFDMAMLVNETRAKPYYDRALQARELADNMAVYLDSLQSMVIATTEGVPGQTADTLQMANFKAKDNYDVPTNLMIGDSEDGSAGASGALKQAIVDYKAQLVTLLDEEDREGARLGLEVERKYEHDGQFFNWEMNTFYHSPLSATVTILNQLESEVRSAEFYVVNKLLKNVNAKSIPIDTIAAKVFAQSNYVPLGQEYTADIFLAAFSKSSQPQVLLGELDPETGQLLSVTDSVLVEDGLGAYTFKPTREGLHEYSGVIRLRDQDNQVIERPFKSEFLVAKPSLVVSAERMNVFYIGPKNPVSVSVPGVPSENLTVRVSGGHSVTQRTKGKYDIICKHGGDRNAKVVVTATFPNGETQTLQSIDFTVKALPKPSARIAEGKSSMLKSALCAQRGIVAEYGKDFIFDLPIRVKSFEMQVARRGELTKVFTSNSNKITDEMKNVICNLSKGNRVFFENIVAQDVSGRKHTLNTITIKVR